MHQRTVIRHAVRDLLIAAGTRAGMRVFPTQKSSLRLQDLPAICVYMLEETVDAESVNMAPRELTRQVPIVIECWVKVGENVDDEMDAIALEVETAMHADPYLGEAVAESILDSTIIVPDPTGDRTMGMVALTYQATYRTLAPEPPSSLDDLDAAGVTYNLGNVVHEDDDAHDLIDLQE